MKLFELSSLAVADHLFPLGPSPIPELVQRSATVSNFVPFAYSCGSSVFVAVRSEGGIECRQTADAVALVARLSPNDDEWEDQSNPSDRKASPQ